MILLLAKVEQTKMLFSQLFVLFYTCILWNFLTFMCG